MRGDDGGAIGRKAGRGGGAGGDGVEWLSLVPAFDSDVRLRREENGGRCSQPGEAAAGSQTLQIVDWRRHLQFPEEAKLSHERKDLICKLIPEMADTTRHHDLRRFCEHLPAIYTSMHKASLCACGRTNFSVSEGINRYRLRIRKGLTIRSSTDEKLFSLFLGIEKHSKQWGNAMKRCVPADQTNSENN